MKIKKKIPDGQHKKYGHYDKAGRWYPKLEIKVEGSFEVRSPSRAWPYSYLKHFYSIKFNNLLFEKNPVLWIEINKIKEKFI